MINYKLNTLYIYNSKNSKNFKISIFLIIDIKFLRYIFKYKNRYNFKWKDLPNLYGTNYYLNIGQNLKTKNLVEPQLLYGLIRQDLDSIL